MINGFLHADGKKILDGSGREVLLKGWGLGNWLLQEGYMWLSGEKCFDRPRRIEQVVAELTGAEYAEQFWKQYRNNYIRREDILKMARLGYNSVRIPFNYRLFMAEDTKQIQDAGNRNDAGIKKGASIFWKKEGFDLLDQCLEWCEEAGIYAFLDLHGAPGGQTGSNIDDSVDNVPRLFMEEQYQEKCIALWEKLAERYCSREVVGGYDLLNEPIIPPYAGNGDFDYLIPELSAFYEKLIHAIRRVDQNHLLSIEGAHWATDVRIFDHKYDENMVLHFHRYAEIPDIACLRKFVEKSDELKVPLWMGETGENGNKWYAALYPLAISLGIGYNLWPWKKMECTNSPYSICKPKEYQMLLDYLKGGVKPTQEKAQEILNEYLENIKMENCMEHSEVTCHVFRKLPFSLRATDFDECPGRGKSFSGTGEENPDISYRQGCGMKIVKLREAGEKQFVFDCQWDRFGLVLGKGEFVCYSLDEQKDMEVEITFAPGYQGGVLLLGREQAHADAAKAEVENKSGESGEKKVLVGVEQKKVKVHIEAGSGALFVRVLEGEVCLARLEFN